MKSPIIRQRASLEISKKKPCIRLGRNTSKILLSDPKLLGFTIARHKVVAKIFKGLKNVLEIGCQEGFGTFFVAPACEHIHSVDFFPDFIKHFKVNTLPHIANCTVELADLTKKTIKGKFDGAFALDVLEHIEPTEESLFIGNIVKSLTPDGRLIIGMPSLESQKYASDASRIGHVNCKTSDELKKFLKKFFRVVDVMGMNDEVLHLGFEPMRHYLMAICSHPRAR